MPTTLDATIGGAASNTYVTLAEASTYFGDRLNSDAWDSASSDNKSKALLTATKVLDSRVIWKGDKAQSSQRLQWPRYGVEDSVSYPDSGKNTDFLDTVIPQFLKDAQCEQALALLTNADQLADTNKGISKVKVDVVELTFDKQDTADVLARPVRDLIEPYAQSYEGMGFSNVSLCRV